VKGVKAWSAGGVGAGWAFQEQYAPEGGYFLQGREQGNEVTREQEIKDLAEAERAGRAPGLDGSGDACGARPAHCVGAPAAPRCRTSAGIGNSVVVPFGFHSV